MTGGSWFVAIDRDTGQPTIDRLNARFTVQPDGCWLWTGPVDRDGYGRFRISGRRIAAHRAVYALLAGQIPEGLTLDHLCRVRACVNPEHLEPVTVGANVLRGDTVASRNADKTECPSGHPYDDQNTYISARGGRHCRACWAAANARRRARAC